MGVGGGCSKGEGGVGVYRVIVKKNDPKCVAASMIHSLKVESRRVGYSGVGRAAREKEG